MDAEEPAKPDGTPYGFIGGKADRIDNVKKPYDKYVVIFVFIAILLQCLSSASAYGQGSEGENYWLPDHIEPEEFSGYFDHPDRPGGTLVTTRFSWRVLEPNKGEYDWAALDARFDLALSEDYSIYLTIPNGYLAFAHASSAVPSWIEDNLDPNHVTYMGLEFNIPVIPAWADSIKSHFEEFVLALGNRYREHPALGAVRIRAISPSMGEEFWFAHGNIPALAANGMTPELLETWLRDRISTFAAAFRGVENRLIWVGRHHSLRYNHNEVPQGEYPLVGQRLAQHADTLGIGFREGHIERYHCLVNEPTWGQVISGMAGEGVPPVPILEQGYMTVDESVSVISDLRFFSDSNEEYNPQNARWVATFGPEEYIPQRYRFSVLRALQARYRFLKTGAYVETINPPLSEYARLSFGKTADDSPDAWVYLNEAPSGTHWSRPNTCTGGHTTTQSDSCIKNFERWLIQREIPDGGMTVPARKTMRVFNTGALSQSTPGWEELLYDYIARRTDIENDQIYIYFKLDERFTIDPPFIINIEYYGGSLSSFRVEYNKESSLDLFSSEPIHTMNDNRVRTASLVFYDRMLRGALSGAMDFRIVCDGPEDVIIQWVRLIRDIEDYVPHRPSWLRWE